MFEGKVLPHRKTLQEPGSCNKYKQSDNSITLAFTALHLICWLVIPPNWMNLMISNQFGFIVLCLKFTLYYFGLFFPCLDFLKCIKMIVNAWLLYLVRYIFCIYKCTSVFSLSRWFISRLNNLKLSPLFFVGDLY